LVYVLSDILLSFELFFIAGPYLVRKGEVFRKCPPSVFAATVIVVVAATVIISPALTPYFLNNGFVEKGVFESGTQPDFQIQIESNQFLVNKGNSTTNSIIFTPINGFVGNVTLGAYVSPLKSSSPSVTFTSSTIMLNESFRTFATSNLVVFATSSTEVGLYNITVTGSNGSLLHSTTAVVGVTSSYVPSNGAELVYVGNFASPAYVDGSTILESTFEDLGYINIGITNLTINIDFGLYRYPSTATNCLSFNSGPFVCDPFVIIRPYQKFTQPLPIQIPNNTALGNHPFAVTVGWTINPQYSIEQPAPNLVAHGSLVVYSRPPNAGPDNANSAQHGHVMILLLIFGGISAIVVLAIGLAIRRTRRPEEVNPEMLQYVMSAKQSLTQKRCIKCGASEPFDAKFCGTCGSPFQ
jgi:ribosomal protein L40E